MKFVLPLMISLALLSGCATKQKHNEFIKTITFSNLATYSYGGIVFEGLELEGDDAEQLTQISERVITEEVSGRGFERVDSEEDFTVIVVWRKAVSTGQDKFNSVHEVNEFAEDRDRIANRISRRYDVSVEMFQTKTGYRFWEKKFPKVFDVLELTEYRVEETLIRALANFPQRVEKDPSLPDIE